jgi:phosphoethanolamine N-methyltransferase
MGHEVEYTDAMIKMLELIWGEGFMAPGGPELADRLVAGIDLEGKRLLDIGSGLGGPCCHLAENHGAIVTGVDIEPQLIEISNRYARQQGLSGQAEFILVEPGPLPFTDGSFDIVISAGAITQIPDKPAIFAECFRILKKGGVLRNFDWTAASEEPSEDLRYFFEVEDLSYALELPGAYENYLQDAGFSDISVADDSGWYRRQSREEYDLLKGPLYQQMVDLLGQADADHFVENWRALAIVFEKGDLTQTIFRSIKPD